MLKYFRYGLQKALHSSSAAEKVVIALGSNVGNRAKAIHDAVDEISKFASVQQTSFLYENPPMYLTDQPAFLNAACEVETDLEPHQLLRALKHIEAELGRDQHGVRNGPRPIDLDIIVHGSHVINSQEPDLVIPHPRLREREFVLRPLCDISEHIPIPLAEGGIRFSRDLLRELLERDGLSGLVQVTPVRSGQLLQWGQRTLLMGIINATPDSFSDGGEFNTIDAAMRQAEEFAKHSFDIVDIGGQSTRPGAEAVPLGEELARVLPLAEALHQAFPSLLISADTDKAAVAEAMLTHGASIINDVSAGVSDPHMAQVLVREKPAAVLMHMRGTPLTMQTKTSYPPGEIATHVATELREQMIAAQKAGVSRWSIIADPGVGFAKKGLQSVELIRSCRAFKDTVGGFPVLLGASRKSWMKEAGVLDKDWATAGAVAAAVAYGGVDLVRVHSAHVADAVRAADALVRT